MMHRRLSVILAGVLISGSSYTFTDSLWIVGGTGYPGDLVTIEVWLQYEGGGATDSMSSFDIPLTWDAAVCTVEAWTIGTDFIDLVGQDWLDVSIIDNAGTTGPPPVSKLTMSCFTFGPPIGAPFVARGIHLAASIDFRILETAVLGDSSCVDTLLSAFSPPILLGYLDKTGIIRYVPTFSTDCIRVPEYACGDVNGDGRMTAADADYIVDYLYRGGPPPVGDADVNGDGCIKMEDACYIVRCVYQGGPVPVCGGIPPCPPPIPSPDDSVEIGHATVCGPATGIPIPITLKNTSSIAGMTVTLKYDTSFVICDSGGFHPGLFADWVPEVVVDSTEGTILMTVDPCLFRDSLLPGSYEVATLWFSSLVGAVPPETISVIDTTFIPPVHRFSLSSVNLVDLAPTIFLGAFEIERYCGDCNGDGRITVADAVYVVSYIYRQGPPMVCECDVNGDTRITVADAIYLVSYIYRGGPSPCEPSSGASPFREARHMGR